VTVVANTEVKLVIVSLKINLNRAGGLVRMRPPSRIFHSSTETPSTVYRLHRALLEPFTLVGNDALLDRYRVGARVV
jgi:hypothetical protein